MPQPAAKSTPEAVQLQLTLELAPEQLLAVRLRRLGFHGFRRLSLHGNRSVMVSLTPRGDLRLHRGYADAPDPVLAAIGRFLTPGVRRAVRLAARRELLDFPIPVFEEPVPPGRRRPAEPPRPGDERIMQRLVELHEILNREYFQGRLKRMSFRLSGRMRTRLGELRADLRTGEATEIAIGRRHLRRDGWEAVRETVLHEMIHQWQAESGLPLDHGSVFRRKAREVGIEARAIRRDLAG